MTSRESCCSTAIAQESAQKKVADKPSHHGPNPEREPLGSKHCQSLHQLLTVFVKPGQSLALSFGLEEGLGFSRVKVSGFGFRLRTRSLGAIGATGLR